MTTNPFSCLYETSHGHQLQRSVQQDATTQVSFVQTGQPAQSKSMTKASSVSTQCPSLCTVIKQKSAQYNKTHIPVLQMTSNKIPYMEDKMSCHRRPEMKIARSKYRKQRVTDDSSPVVVEDVVLDHFVTKREKRPRRHSHTHSVGAYKNSAEISNSQSVCDKQDTEMTENNLWFSEDMHHIRSSVKKRRKKLMIVGRLKCLPVGHYWKGNRVAKPATGRGASLANKNAVGDGCRRIKEKTSFKRHCLICSTTQNACEKNISEKPTEFYILKSSKADDDMSKFPAMGGNFRYCDSFRNHIVKQTRHRQLRNCSQQRSSGSHRTAQNLGWMIVEQEPKDTREKHLINQTCVEGREIQPHESLKYVANTRSPFHKPKLRRMYHFSKSELLPSYSLNVNSNAGISESGPEGAKTTEIKQPSCTSVHSTDQYYSTHTDTPDGKVIDSDVDVSPSFSLTEEGVEKITATTHEACEAIGNKNSEQSKKITEELEEKKENLVQTSADAGKQKKGHEAPSFEDSQNEKHVIANQSVAQDLHVPAANSKHKKKTKTTEALYIKFESSMSKKVTTTTVLKDGKRPAISKTRSEPQKQLPPVNDSQKSVAGVVDKIDNKTVTDNPRYTKIVRYSEGHHDNTESKPKHKENCVLDLVTGNEARHGRAAQGHNMRPTASDHRCYQVKNRVPSISRTEMPGHGKPASTPEKITYQGSPNKASSVSHTHDHKHDVIDSDCALERESSAATIVNMLPTSPAKNWPLREQSGKSELSNKAERTKGQLDSPRKDRSTSRERKELPRQTVSSHRRFSSTKVDKKEEIKSISVTVSAHSVKSPVAETSSRKRSLIRGKSGSPFTKSPGDTRLDSKKQSSAKKKSKSNDDFTAKEDLSESSKSAQQSSSVRKKSHNRTKTFSGSPETKKKRRNSKKIDSKILNDMEENKWEKHRKQKINEKMVDKKKKKKKQKHKQGDDDSSESQKSTKKGSFPSRSRSSEFSKTTQTLSCSLSAPHLDAQRSDMQLSPLNHSRRDDNKFVIFKERTNMSDDLIRSLDREYTASGRELRIRSCAFSAENVSITSSGSKSVRCAESVPTFTGTVYKALTKVVQVATCHKNRKTDKDLQQAEMGWNSNTFSAEEKAAAEKTKQNKKLTKVRYYIVKPKSTKGDKETGVSKMKRANSRPNNTEGDGVCSTSEGDDATQQDKSKLGLGKSVQFSDSIQDLEAPKEDTGNEKAVIQEPETDNSMHPPTSKPNAESVNKPTEGEPPAVTKPPVQKKEESKQPATPPRKKRPVWMRKPSKTKASAGVKATASTKSVSAIVPFKQRQSSEHTLKPGSRFNVHLYYPVKPAIGSPMLSNISLSEKRTVAYNTWINSIFLAAPMNKATRKLVAKTGSPVDIKEIIEGSSVDAADHFRAMRTLHESGVRAAKSAPFLGPQRGASMEMAGNKRLRQADEGRSVSQKRNRETKPQETSSTRSASPTEGSDDQGMGRNFLGDVTTINSRHSTEVDSVTGRNGFSRLIGQNSHRKRDKKQSKKPSVENPLPKWRRVAVQEGGSIPDLPQGHYYGDMADINVLNIGLNWMVQRVFRRIPFLHSRQPTPSANASGDMPTNHQVVQ